MSKRRSWSDEEKLEIRQQRMLPGVSVTQVARRYAMNANMIHNWFKDPRFAPAAVAPEATVEDDPVVEVVIPSPDLPLAVDVINPSLADPVVASRVDITPSDRRRILAEGPTALASMVGFVQGLMA